MELIRKSDALHAVLHNQGDAAVAAVQNIKPILTITDADAIERLMEEVDRKDKAIQGLLTQIESKDKEIERMRYLMRHYKNAYRTAYKLYQEARNEQQP